MSREGHIDLEKGKCQSYKIKSIKNSRNQTIIRSIGVLFPNKQAQLLRAFDGPPHLIQRKKSLLELVIRDGQLICCNLEKITINPYFRVEAI